jgi:hypothetical protein
MHGGTWASSLRRSGSLCHTLACMSALSLFFQYFSIPYTCGALLRPVYKCIKVKWIQNTLNADSQVGIPNRPIFSTPGFWQLSTPGESPVNMNDNQSVDWTLYRLLVPLPYDDRIMSHTTDCRRRLVTVRDTLYPDLNMHVEAQ